MTVGRLSEEHVDEWNGREFHGEQQVIMWQWRIPASWVPVARGQGIGVRRWTVLCRQHDGFLQHQLYCQQLPLSAQRRWVPKDRVFHWIYPSVIAYVLNHCDPGASIPTGQGDMSPNIYEGETSMVTSPNIPLSAQRRWVPQNRVFHWIYSSVIAYVLNYCDPLQRRRFDLHTHGDVWFASLSNCETSWVMKCCYM